jgi:hypothetical protein
MRENCDFATKIYEINGELSENSQRYINECCESESDGKIDGFGAGCCKRSGGVAVAMWCILLGRKEGVGERGEERRGKVGPPGAGGKEASTTGGRGERVEESGGRGTPAEL